MTDFKAKYEQFAYIVSHDLSAPLRQIRGFLDIFLEDTEMLTENQIQSKGMMIKAIDDAEAMIHGLLKLSRINGHTLSKDTINLDEILHEIQKDYSEYTILMENIPEIAEVDEHIFRSTIKELIDNAIKFQSSERPLEIVVSGVLTEQSENLKICVSDNGIGIDSEYIDRAFQPLQQLHPKQAYDGAGIGLTLCKAMMDLHGGTVQIQSNSDKGITACLSF